MKKMEDSDSAENKKKDIDELRSKIHELKQQKIKVEETKKFVPLTGILIFVVMLIVYFFIIKSTVAVVIGIFYFFIALIYPLFGLSEPIANEIDALESELAFSLTGVEAKEERAERLFKLHDIGLKKYYDQALNQTKVIFIMGIFCMIVGFVFIGLSFYFIFTNSGNNINKASLLNEKILVGVLGTASGILTNFVAVVYLKMYNETTKSFTSFHYKLVSTNHLHFVNFLLSKIEDKEIFNKALKDIATKVTKKIK